MSSTIQSVSSNASCVHDASEYLSIAPAPPLEPAASGEPSCQSAAAPAVIQLLKQNPPGGANSCTEEGVALAIAGANVLGSLGRVVVAAPSVVGEIPALLGFIASAMVAGAAAAKYVDCKEQAERPNTR